MRVIETTLGDNLAAISGYLWNEGIPHRIFEERGRQILEVRDPRQAARTLALYTAWRDGRLELVAIRPEPAARRGPAHVFGQLRQFPALTALVLLAIGVFPFSVVVSEGGMNAVAAALLIADPTDALAASGRVGGTGAWQVWRWLTPIFLHFSVMHLAFNCVIVIDLGRRIEAACGTWMFVLLVGLIGIVSNLVQYWVGASALFGGLSGVGYGLLGYLLVMRRRFPADVRWRLPAGLAFGLLIFLVVFSTGVTEPFGLHVANGAHWAGLGAGAILALFIGARRAYQKESSDE